MQIFALPLKTLCKLSLASGRAGGKKRKNNQTLSLNKKEKKYGHEGWWTGVKIKIYILMEKRVPHRPWSKH